MGQRAEPAVSDGRITSHQPSRHAASNAYSLGKGAGGLTRCVLVVVAAASSIVLSASVAMAGPQPQKNPNSWYTNDYAGACGDTTGGYVLAIQEAAFSRGSYGGPLDSLSGPNTVAGIRGLQAFFGLSQDGCAGPLTWEGVRTRLFYVGPPPGYVVAGPRYAIDFGARAQYYDYNGCWASYAFGGTASPVAQNRYYLFKRALDGRTPQPPTTYGGTLPYCGTI